MNIYGGHIYDVKEALRRLYLEKENFDYFFDSQASSDVQQCLDWKFHDESDNLRMHDTLWQLSIRGFVPLAKIDDPVANFISENIVGGVIRKSGMTVGLSRQVWKDNMFEYGIVTSKQSIRLVIAKILGDKDSI